MDFIVDKRTELMCIILALSQGNEYIEEHFSFDIKDEYRQQVYNHFSKYKNHKAVELARQIAKNDEGFSFDNPIRLAFALNEELVFDGKIEEYLLLELKNEETLKEFICEIVSFAKDSNFEEFYNANKDYYYSKISELKQIFNADLFVCELQKFLKFKIEDNFVVNIVPMLINANHGFKVDCFNFANIGMLSEDFKTINIFNNGTIHTIIHEFVHNFVNCYADNNQLRIPDEFRKKLKNMGYGNPISYLNDTIVRAITIRLREKIENIDIQKFFDIENKFGFIYVKKVYKELLVYENQTTSWEKYISTLLEFITRKEENNQTL
mgnify:FL=1